MTMHLAQSLASLQLDPTASAPMFRQLYEAVKQTILAGTIGPGMQLPPTRELASQLRVSRQTVLNAYAQLMAEGYLSGTVGRGTFVSASLPIAPKSRLHGVAARPQMLRPLSARGQCFVGPQAVLNYHSGVPKAFRIGMPGLDVFPFDVWARLEARRWRHTPHELGYGDAAGFHPLREGLAAYLGAARGVHCAPEQIIITSGSQQALFLIASLLLSPGDASWVEEPGYRGINASLRAAQAHVCHIPIDDEGLSVSFGAAMHPDAKLTYVTPSHQLPLGVTMSLQRRLELLAWAAEKRMWVVEDDYDSEYRYTGPPIASLQSLDKAGCVIYVGTLSKVLFPGLRLGYIVAPPALAEAFAQGKAILDRHTAIGPQMVLADFIAEGHFSRHIKRTREVYAERRATLLDAIAAHMPDEFHIGPADAGLHLPVRFRRKRNDQMLTRTALPHGIELRALSQFYNADQEVAGLGSRVSGLLLGFASIPEAEIKRGVSTLRGLLEK
ncbi:PLP-dependent aminotransferase family protein [Noviherbaspirillum sp.]|uniref:MocR-like pyridoxine biosynthesis transcription factor PdxR n=1 Tax=Noviherbaspirillum sp. TaxID=1926288 RepID=UPI002B45A54E|nr:PLP-dependent aminotransferase family protein [Noviherbaspirillum sp.]HJV80101.1 PLP-dependent aminotransferase family protein [Noviherbaspirillum sp.]